MSVIGRLWRRAPAWRMCVGVALAGTALAAMFPPAWQHPAWQHPNWQRPAWLNPAPSPTGVAGATPAPPETPAVATTTPAASTTSAAGPPGPAAASAARAARYVPQPDTTPLTYSTIERPPLAEGRQSVVPHAGRLMPLPTGRWQEIAFVRGGGTLAVQASLLDRVDAGRLTGLLLVASPAPVGRVAGPVAVPPLCVAPDTLAHDLVAAAPGQDPTAHECWTVTVADMAELASPQDKDALLRQGLERLNTLHVTLPEHMLVVHLIRSDAGGWMVAAIFLPDRRAEQPGAMTRLEEWAKRFERLFHRGFDGTLSPGEVTATLARDPQG